MVAKHYKLVLILCLLPQSFGCGPNIENVSHRKKIDDLFYRYKNAVINNNGDTATQLISKESLERFDDFREWAISDTPQQLKERSLYEQIHVHRLRHSFEKEELRNSTGSRILGKLIEQGRYTTRLLENSEIGLAVFQKEKRLCYLRLFDGNQLTKNRVVFIEEQGSWKIHLLGMEIIESNAYRAIMENQGLDESEFLSRILKGWQAAE